MGRSLERRVVRKLVRCEVFLVESGLGYFNVKTRSRFKSERERKRANGTFARLPLDARPSDDMLRMLVRASMEVGRVLTEDESMSVILAAALKDNTKSVLDQKEFWIG